MQPDIPQLLSLFRSEVRAQRAYRVPTEIDDSAKLDQNECPYDVPDDVKAAVLDAFRKEPWNRYPADRPHDLIAKLSEVLDWPVDGIIVGRGSNELTHTLGLCLIDRGTNVVLPDPMFALYANVVKTFGGEVVAVPADENIVHSADAVIAAMQQSNAQLTVVCAPNNPTGHTFTYEELDRMAEAAPGFFVIDEAYVEFCEGATALDILRKQKNVIVVRTLSKAMGLAGIRIGYLAAHPEIVAELEKPRLPFLIDRLSEMTAIALLDRPEIVQERVAELSSERDRILSELRLRDDVEIAPSNANFFLFRCAIPASELQQSLFREGVRVRPMSGFKALAGGDGGRFDSAWVRISVGTPSENRRLMKALASVLAAH